jgi:DNA processing protein
MIREFKPEDLLGPLNDVEARRSPKRIFLDGNENLFSAGPRVSIVGSRKASQDGIKRAKQLSRLLAQNGVIVVSGLAEGIDAAAHRAAIDCGGSTIAVLGTPLDKTYPKSNFDLQRQIIENHAAISQFEVGYPTTPKNFIMRNGTMALIVCASVIVEASDTSGALSQGWEALRLGRLLFIMESLFNTSLEWPHEMLKYGAQILSNDNIENFLDVLPVGGVCDNVCAF